MATVGIALAAGEAAGQSSPPAPAAPGGAAVPSLSLDQARQAGSGKTVRVVGYVVGSYVCPPCPPGATCKPCAAPSEVFLAPAPDHLRVVLFDPANDVFAVGVDDPAPFALGSQYRFEVTTTDRHADGIDGRLLRSQRPDEAIWPDAPAAGPGVAPNQP